VSRVRVRHHRLGRPGRHHRPTRLRRRRSAGQTAGHRRWEFSH